MATYNVTPQDCDSWWDTAKLFGKDVLLYRHSACPDLSFYFSREEYDLLGNCRLWPGESTRKGGQLRDWTELRLNWGTLRSPLVHHVVWLRKNGGRVLDTSRFHIDHGDGNDNFPSLNPEASGFHLSLIHI